MDKITRENWPENWSKVPEWTEVDEEVYEYFFNVLPPRYMCGFMFQAGEPYDHADNCGKWQGRYLTFVKRDGKCWFNGINFPGHYNAPSMEVFRL